MAWLNKTNFNKIAEQAKQATSTFTQQATQQLGQLRPTELQLENDHLRKQVSALEQKLRASQGNLSLASSTSEADVAALHERLQQVLETSALKDEELHQTKKTVETLQAKLAMLHSNAEADRLQHAVELKQSQEALQAALEQPGVGPLDILQDSPPQPDSNTLALQLAEAQQDVQRLATEKHELAFALQQANEHRAAAEKQAEHERHAAQEVKEQLQAARKESDSALQHLRDAHTVQVLQLQQKAAQDEAKLNELQEAHAQELEAVKEQLAKDVTVSKGNDSVGPSNHAADGTAPSAALSSADSLDVFKMAKELEELRQYCEDLRGANRAKAEAESKLGILTQQNKELQVKLQQLAPLIRKQDDMDIKQLSKQNTELKSKLRAAQSALDATDRTGARRRLSSTDFDAESPQASGPNSPVQSTITPRASSSSLLADETGWMDSLEEFRQRQESLQELIKEYQSTVHGGQKVVVLKQLNDLYATHVDVLQRQCTQMYGRNRKLERTLKDVQARCNELERNQTQERDLLRSQSDRATGDLQAQVSTLQKQLARGEQQALNDRRAAAHLQVELQDKLDAAKGQLNTVQQQLRAALAEKAAATSTGTQEVGALQSRIADLESALIVQQDMQRQVEELQAANRKLLQGVSQLHSTLITSKASLRGAKGTNGAAEPDSPTSCSSSLSGFDGVAYQLEAFQSEIEQLQAAMQDRDNQHAQKVEAMKGDVDSLQAQLRSVSEQHEAVRTQLQELQTQHQQVLQEHEAVLHEKEQVQQRLIELQQQQQERAAEGLNAKAEGCRWADALAVLTGRWSAVCDCLRAAAEGAEEVGTPASTGGPSPQTTLANLAEAMMDAQALLLAGDMPTGTAAAEVAQRYMTDVLQQTHGVVARAAELAADLESAVRTAELDAEQLREELLLRNQQQAQQSEGETSAMQARLLTLQSEAQHWSERMDSAGEIAIALRDQVQQFESECVELRGMLKSLQEEYAVSQQALTEAMNEADSMEEQLQAEKMQVEQLQQQLFTVQASAAEAHSGGGTPHTPAHDGVLQHHATVSSDSAGADVDDLQQQLEAAQQEVAAARKETADTVARLEAAEISAEARKQEMETELKNMTQTAEEQCEAANAAADKAKEQLAQAEQQLADVQAREEDVKQQLVTAQQQVEDGTQELAMMADRLKQAEGREAAAHEQVAGLRQQRQEAQTHWAALQTQLHAAQQEAAEARQRVVQVESAAQLAATGANTVALELADARANLAEAHQQVGTLKLRAADAEQECSIAQERVTASESKVDELTQQLQNVQTELQQSVLNAVEVSKQLQDAKQQVQEARAEARRLKAEHEAALQDTTSNSSELQQQVEQVKDQLQTLQQQKTEADVRYEDLEQQYRDAQVQLDKVQQQVKVLNEEHVQLQEAASRAAELQATCDKLQGQIADSAAAAAQERTREADEHAQAMSKLQEQIATLQGKLEMLQNEKATHVAKSTDAVVAKQQLETQLQELTLQLAQAQEAGAAHEASLAAQQAELHAAAAEARRDSAAQQELAMQAVQQLADARSALAESQAEAAAAQKELAQVQAMLTERSKALKAATEQQSRAVERCQQLEKDMEQVQQKSHREQAEWSQERSSLNERLARLQKINQTRRADLDELQAKLVVAQHGAASSDALSGEVKMLQQESAALRQKIEKQHTKIQEAEAARDQVQGRMQDVTSELESVQQRLLAADGKVVAAAQERDVLQDKVSQLRAENKRLGEALAEAANMKEELQGLKDAASELEAERSRAAQLESAKDRTQRELQSMTNMIVKIEEKLRVAEEEVEHLTGLVEEERRRNGKIAMSYAEELESLASKRRDRSSWPTPVRLLVEDVEAAASEAAAAALRATFESEVASLEDTMQELKQQTETALQGQQEAEKSRSAMNERLQQVEQELQDRELALQEQIAKAQSGSSRRATRLEADLAAAKLELENARMESQCAVAEQRSQVQSLSKELEEVRGRARMMMEEKDAVIAGLRREAKQQATCSGGASGTATPQGLSPATGSGIINRPAGEEVSSADGGVTEDDSGVAAEFDRAHVTGVDGYGSYRGSDLLSRVILMEQQLAKVTRELEEAEKTNRLRENAQQVLKEELAEIRRQEKRHAIDVDYLKNVLVDGFATGELPTNSPMFLVLSRLLLFSPDEVSRIRQGAATHTPSGSTSSTITSLLRPLQLPGLAIASARTLPASAGVRTVKSPRASGSMGRGHSGPVGGGQGWEATLQALQKSSPPAKTRPASPDAMSLAGGAVEQQLFAGGGSATPSPRLH